MVSSVDGKYAIVTGAGSGINLAFTKLLLEQGCSVMVADINLSADAQKLLSTYAPQDDAPVHGHDGTGGRGRPSAHFHKTDVTSWQQLTALWNATLDVFPFIDIVVPGAGIFEYPQRSFWDSPKTETDPSSASHEQTHGYDVLDINLIAPIRLSQLAIAYWTEKERTRGDVNLVLIGSIAGRIQAMAVPLYIASKHAVHGFARSLGPLRDSLGIRVGCVAPCPVATAIFDKCPDAAADCDMVPVGEVTDAMLELIVNDDYGDGTILQVTAGRTFVVPLFNAPTITEEEIRMPALESIRKKILTDLGSKAMHV